MPTSAESTGNVRGPRIVDGIGLLVPGWSLLRRGRLAASLGVYVIDRLLLAAGFFAVAAGRLGGAASCVVAIVTLRVLGIVSATLSGHGRTAAPRVVGGPWAASAAFAHLLLLGPLVWWLGPLRIVEVAGTSMTPTLHPQDFLLVSRCSAEAVHRNDVVLAVPPDDRTLLTVKRVAALGGDKVTFGFGGVIAVEHAGAPDGPIPFGLPTRARTLEIPPRQFFLVGDSIPDSRDSREYGPIDASRLRGCVRAVVWSPARRTWPVPLRNPGDAP